MEALECFPRPLVKQANIYFIGTKEVPYTSLDK